MTVAAAIPVLNEARTIGRLVDEVRQRVDAVLVVDDGSADDGAAFARDSGAEVISHDANRGKGVALVTALRWARERPEISWLVILDGDGQHDPTEITDLVDAAVRQGLDILVGSRFIGDNNAPFYRVVGLHVLSATAALGSGVRLTDSQSGFRVLSRRAIELLELHEGGFSVEAEMQFLAADIPLQVGEAPISILYAGPARRSPIMHGVSVLGRTVALTFRHRPWRLPMLLAMPVALWRLHASIRSSTKESHDA